MRKRKRKRKKAKQMWAEIEILKRLESLLGPLANRLQLPTDQLVLLVVILLFLALIFVAKEVNLRFLQSRRRARHLQSEVGRLSELADANQARLVEVLESLHSLQQWQNDAPLTSDVPEHDGIRQVAEELSRISHVLVELKDSMEKRQPPATTTNGLSPLGLDIFADLPQEPEARIATLEQRRQILFSAIRECNQAIEDEKRTPLSPEALTRPEVKKEDIVAETIEQENQTRKVEKPQTDESDAPSSDSPTPPTPEEPETDFSSILSEEFERDLLRLVLRENGRPNSESIRLVLGTRFQHVVQDEINERAQNVLDDDLLYEEDGRLVVSEEFVDDLKRFLND